MGRNVIWVLVGLAWAAIALVIGAEFWSRSVSAQQLRPGSVWGNPLTTQAPPRDSTPTQILDVKGVFFADDYGTAHNFVPGGGTDDTAAIAAALQAAQNAGGGTVYLGPYSYLVNSANLVVQPGVELSCQRELIPLNPQYDFTSRQCALYIDSTHTLSLRGGISNIYVLNSNITYPTTTRQAITALANFTGTGVTVNWHESHIRNVFVGGFNQCIDWGGAYSRPRFDNVYGDCQNGARFDGVHDQGAIHTMEFHPYMNADPAFAIVDYAISGAADNGAGLYRLTLPANVLITGDTIYVHDTTGAQGANGKWTVTYVDATHVDLQGSATAPAPTGNTTINQTYVTVSSTANLAVGQTVTGTGIPGGATIVAVSPGGPGIVLSAPATATGALVPLTIGNTAYSAGGTARINTNMRTGVGFAFTNSELISCIDCFAYGYVTGSHIGTAAGWIQFVNFSYDSDSTLRDNSNIGVLVDGTSYGFSWIGGFTSSVDRAISIASGANAVPNVISGVSLSKPATPHNVMIEHVSGYVSYNGVTSGSGAYYMVFGPGTPIHALVSNSIWPSGLSAFSDETARSSVVFAPTNDIPNASVGIKLTNTGRISVGASTSSITVPLVVSGSSTADVSRGAEIQISNLTATPTTKFMRVNNVGALQILNSAYSTPIMTLTDGGAATFPAAMQLPVLSLNTATPYMRWYANGAGVDQKYWDFGAAAAGDLTLRADNDAFTLSNPALKFVRGAGYTVTSATVYTAAGVQALQCDVTQHCQRGNATAPTIASGACGALTNGAVVAGSNDQSMEITIGAAATTSCAITFAGTWTLAPRSCSLTPSNAAAAAWGTTGAYISGHTATTVTITGSALAGANYSVQCE
jgi:hypothetical protein